MGLGKMFFAYLVFKSFFLKKTSFCLHRNVFITLVTIQPHRYSLLRIVRERKLVRYDEERWFNPRIASDQETSY